MSRRWRDPLVSRRRRLDPPWVPSTPTPPMFPPSVLESRRRTRPVRRGRSFSPPRPVESSPIIVQRRARSYIRPRRGSFQVPPPVVVPPPASTPIIPSMQRQARPARPPRRRHGSVLFPWTQQTPPSVLRGLPSRRSRVLPVRRGRIQRVIGTTAPPVMPPPPIALLARRTRQTRAPRRKAVFTFVVTATAPVVGGAVDITVHVGPTQLLTAVGATRALNENTTVAATRLL
jgi:hypothetical protein